MKQLNNLKFVKKNQELNNLKEKNIAFIYQKKEDFYRHETLFKHCTTNQSNLKYGLNVMS